MPTPSVFVLDEVVINPLALDDEPVVNRVLVSSPDAEPLTTLPDARDMHPNPDPVEVLRLRRYVSAHPFLAFIPSPPRWDSPILKRFQFLDGAFPILPVDNNRFALNSVVQRTWSRMEGALTFMIHLLLAHLPPGESTFPLDLKFFPLPSTYGYMRSHRLSHVAQKCAQNSRDAFLPLIGMCSWVIAIHEAARKTLPYPQVLSVSRWTEILQNRGGVHPEFICEIVRSPIADMSERITRLGVVLDMRFEENHKKLLQKIQHAHVPVWLIWGDPQKGPLVCHTKHMLLPGSHLVNQAIAQFADDERCRGLQEASSRLATVARKPPAPHPGSGQRAGETMEAFFARRSERHILLAAKEDLKAQNDRMRLAEKCTPDRVPVRFEAQVFQWVDVNGFLTRVPLTHRELLESMWRSTPDDSKVFNAFDREWDICPVKSNDAGFTFANDAPMDNVDDDDTPMDDMPPPPPPLSVDPNPAQLPDGHWRDDLFSVFGQPNIDQRSTPSLSLPFDNSLNRVLYMRFGFQLEGSAWASIPWQHPPQDEWNKLVKASVQDGLSAVLELSHGPIYYFCNQLLMTDDVQRLPGLPWDLGDTHANCVRARLRVDLVISTQKDQQDCVIYFIDETNNTSTTPAYRLVVTDPLSALLCIRLASNIQQCVRLFLEHGVPFRTLLPLVLSAGSSKLPSPESLADPSLSLGLFPHGHRFDSVHYTAYTSRRDRFLMGPRGRAAAKMGGIVWRLAMEAMNPNAVLAGPSDESIETGHIYKFSAGNTSYYDDELSAEELRLICGVYEMETGASFTLTL